MLDLLGLRLLRHVDGPNIDCSGSLAARRCQIARGLQRLPAAVLERALRLLARQFQCGGQLLGIGAGRSSQRYHSGRQRVVISLNLRTTKNQSHFKIVGAAFIGSESLEISVTCS